MLSWGLVVRLGCSPLVRFWWIIGMYAVLWVYMLIGAAIFMTIENPTRRETAATEFLQGEINYSESVYFTVVFVTTCGLGDIIPVTDGGRILVCVWSFFGTALWLALLSSIVSFLCDFVYVEVILNAYWFLRTRRMRAQMKAAAAAPAATDTCRPDLAAAEASTTSTRDPDQAQADQARAIGGTNDDAEEDENEDSDSVSDDDEDDEDDEDEEEEDVEKQDKKTKATAAVGEEGREHAPTWKENVKDRSLLNDTLSWRSLFLLNVVALTLYFLVHIVCAGVFFGLEPRMGWLGDNLTPRSYSTYFYASFTYSQTICFGTDYAPRTASGRAFFVVWQQLNYIVATFLFSTVAMAIIRYSRAKIAFVLERVMVRTYGPRFRRTLRRMSRRMSLTGETTAASG